MKFTSVRLIAADIKAMVTFYELVTGQAADWLAPQFAEIVTPAATLAIGGAETVAAFAEGNAKPGANRTAILECMVEDLDAAFERLEGKAELVHEPKLLPWGTVHFRSVIPKAQPSVSSCFSPTPRRPASGHDRPDRLVTEFLQTYGSKAGTVGCQSKFEVGDGLWIDENMAMTTMRAAIQDQYGAPEVLHVRTIARPVPGQGEVLVRVMAASVNGYDVLLRSGALKMIAGRKFPKMSGLDFVGSVTEAFADSPFQVGDSVWGVLPLHRLGAVADYVAINPGSLSLRPIGLSPTEAAALPVVGATALAALRDVAALRSGERLLIRGAAGGVGSVAVQLGKVMGAHITGLASGRDLAFVRDLGADVALDYLGADPARLGTFDVILDTVGTGTRAFRRLLSRHGRLAAIVPDRRRPLRWVAYAALSRIHGERRVRYFSASPNEITLSALARFVDDGTVRPIIEGVYPLERIAQAHRAFETPGMRGKQIIALA